MKTNQQEDQNENLHKSNIPISQISNNETKHLIISNTISLLGLLVSTFLAIYTYLLFRETQKSTNAAITASNEAIRATDISEKNYELAKKSQEQSEIAFKNNLFRMERESDASLQFFDVSTTGITFQPGKAIKKQFYLKNLGKYTVKLLSFNADMKILENSPNATEISKSSKQPPKNVFVSPESPLELGITSNFKVSDEQYNSVIETNKSAIYIYGYILFQNQVTLKIKKYEFVIKNDGLITTNFEYNKTTFIKK